MRNLKIMELLNTLIPSGLRLIILVVIAMAAIANVAQTATVPSNPTQRGAADETVANNDIDLLTYNASHLLQEHFGFCISNSYAPVLFQKIFSPCLSHVFFFEN